MKKTMIEILNELNDYTGKTLSITSYETNWLISSYGDNTLFLSPATIWDKSFKDALIVVYKIMQADKKKKKEGIK